MYTHLVVHLGLVVFAARAEAGAGSPLLAVPGDVTRVAAGGAHDAVGDVGLVLALPRLVVGGPAVGAPGALALAQGAVEQRQFAQLGTPAGGMGSKSVHSFDESLIHSTHSHLRSFCPSGTLIPAVITSLIFSTAFFTASRLWAVTYACSGSSSPGKGCPSFLATFERMS